MPPTRLFRLFSTTAAVLLASWCAAAPARAGVVVLANRTAAKIGFKVLRPDGAEQQHSLDPRDVLPVPVADKIGIAFDAGGSARRYLLRANSIHYFLTRDGKLDLIQIELPPASGAAPPPAPPGPQAASLFIVPVMILVDQHEPAVQRIWEKRLRDRLREASEIFERCCRVRFDAVAVGIWTTDDSIVKFDLSMRDFEATVIPAPASLAIGFTSYYRLPQGKAHLGGTRGPLHPHILVREWPQHIGKAERLEVLVHEMGHFLGAVHSPEPDSVMRPELGDRRSNARDFRIGFDPLNTFAMYLVGEELRSRQVRSLVQVRPATKAHLRGVYQTMAALMPSDPAARLYLQLLDVPGVVGAELAHHPKPLIEHAGVVVQAVTEAARQNVRLPAAASAGQRGAVRVSGDRLTEFYVRRAAAAAHELPPEWAAKALLLGLGIGLDHSAMLRDSPLLGSVCREVESDRQRAERLAMLGSPTLQGRRDLCQHFVVSCALTVMAGSQLAETAGIIKELNDSQGGSGFSFADLSADMAGVAFANRLIEKKLALATVAVAFNAKDFFPAADKLPERISWQEFLATYGSTADDRFYRLQKAIRERILALPGHRQV